MALSSEAIRWVDENRSRLLGQALVNEPLSKHTYYQIGGPAALFISPKSADDLSWVIEARAELRLHLFVLGAGSNMLVSDEGFEGIVVKASRLNQEISQISETRIRTGSAVAVSTLLRRAAQEGWAGLEFLTGVPGSIGGVVTMNAGTHLGEAKSTLRRLEYFHLDRECRLTQPESFEQKDFKYEYRRNHFIPESAFVWSAEWEIRCADPSQVKREIDEMLARRKSTQPVEYPSCGSVFKNPREHGMSAWQVVDKLGLRGHRIGNAQFAEKHSNFIINLGGAKAADVRGLIDLAKSRALVELGVELHEEVRYLGNFGITPPCKEPPSPR